LSENQHELARDAIWEAVLCDANTAKLPKRARIPFKEGDWHPLCKDMT